MYITKKWADSSLVLILRQNNYVVIYDKKVFLKIYVVGSYFDAGTFLVGSEPGREDQLALRCYGYH